MRFPIIYTTLNNNSVLLWCSIKLAEETEAPHPRLTDVTDKRYYIRFYRVHLTMYLAFELKT